MKQVLLITNQMAGRSQTDVLRQFTEGLNAGSEQVRYDFCVIQDLIFSLSAEGICSVTLNGTELKDAYAAIHLRNMHKFSDYATALRLYAENSTLRLLNMADATYPYNGKVSQGFRLAGQGVPTPAFISSASNQRLLAALEQTGLGFPLIVKHNEGIKGQDNYLVQDFAALRTILAQPMQHFLAQPFIQNNGELRVLTFGDAQPPLVFKKQAVAGTHLNNTSQGGNAMLVEPSELNSKILADALQAAKATGREIGGVDVLLADNGAWYVLEINSTPQIATGAFMEEKIEHYNQFFLREMGV